MKKNIVYLSAFMVLCFSDLAFAEEIVMALGQIHSLSIRTQKVWVQDHQIVSVKAESNRIILKGLNEGSTLLQANGRVFQIQVLHPNSLSLFKVFQKIVSKIPGLKVAMSRGQVAISGQLYRWSDWKKLADQTPEQTTYRLQAEISELVQHQAEYEIQKVIEKNGLRPQKLIFADTVQLRISQKHSDLDELKKLLSPFGVQFILDNSQIKTEQTIKVQITIAEVHKDLMRTWGAQWGESALAEVSPKFSLLADPVQVQLNALETRNEGRVLASPNLICQSGQEADFFAGGEFPVKFVNYKVKEVIWKKYGISLKVRPLADSSGRMTIHLETEISSLFEVVDGIPSLLSHKVSSTFDLNQTRTIVLSGLMKEETNDSTKGLPWLSQIPIFGRLFSSQDFLNKKTELLVFVRPEIVLDSRNLKSLSQLKHLESEPFQ